MKTLLFTLIHTIMFSTLIAQNIVYDARGNKARFVTEDIDITFTRSAAEFQQKYGPEFAPSLIPILPALADIAFNLTSRALEGRVKKFTGEYTKQKSNLDAGNRSAPDITFERKLTLEEDGPLQSAIKIELSAHKIENMEAFIYWVKSINLQYSAAKATSRSKRFDYTFELKPTLLVEGEKKTVELAPIVISSVGFNEPPFEAMKHRTDIVLMPAGALLTEVSLKIVESNPQKVRAEKILSLWNDNKDSAKTIVNNFLPKEKEEEGNNGENGGHDSTGN